MNTRWIWQAGGTLPLLIVCGAAALLRAGASGNYYLTPVQGDYIAGLRAAALRGDRACIPDLLKALHDDKPAYRATALHGLRHLHVTEALPDLDAEIQQSGGEDHDPDAAATRAVLLAPPDEAALAAQQEATARQDKQTAPNALAPDALLTTDAPVGASRMQAAHTQATHLLQTLRFDSAGLATGLEAYRRAQVNMGTGWTPAIYAFNQLADLAYYGDYAAYRSLPEFKILSETNVPGASLKLQYAAVPPALRYKRLVDDLATRGKDDIATTGKEGEMLQLAIDEGLPASRYAAAKLLEMDKHRQQYAKTVEGKTYIHAGFASLFRLIAGVGDKAQLPVIEHFLHDTDGYIGYYAKQVHGQVAKGLRSSWAVGY